MACSVRSFFAASLSILFMSCAGALRPPAVGPGNNPNAAHFLEIYSAPHVAGLHFPAGTYSLGAADRVGYYYRAPRAVLEHTGGGSVARQGGIFVSKRDLRKLRGYVYLAGGVTHVGNFSRVAHQFHD
ncbi:MAG: hypothetical protein QOG48_1506 [Verrucomicrobiota bacterium]|jgi:hypothetical protein